MITMSMFQEAIDSAAVKRDQAKIYEPTGTDWLYGLQMVVPDSNGTYHYVVNRSNLNVNAQTRGETLPMFLELLTASGFQYQYSIPKSEESDQVFTFAIKKTDKVLPPTLSEIRQATKRKQEALEKQRASSQAAQIKYLREQVGKFHVITAIQEAALLGADSVEVQVISNDLAHNIPGYSAAMFSAIQLLTLEGYSVKQRGDKLTVDWSDL